MKSLNNNVINVWGTQGNSWFNRLPDIVAQLTQHWQLSHVTPVANMSYNYVAKATQNNTIPIVLKISCDKNLINDEYRALNYFKGKGSIRALDIYSDLNALLLEQAIPGHHLKEHPTRYISDTIKIYANAVKALESPPRALHEFIHVEKWCEAIDTINDKRIKSQYVDKAKALREFLLSTAKKEYLCHGDLHSENIIRHEDKWVSIDPKGIIAEMAFEAAAFDLVDDSEWNKPETITNTINQRLDALVKNLEIDEKRLLGWVFLRVIISAQWFIEDNGNPKKMLNLAPALYSLLSKT